MGVISGITRVVRKVIPSANERTLRKLEPYVAAINELESEIRELTDDELKAKTSEFKSRLEKGETLDDLLVECHGPNHVQTIRSCHLFHGTPRVPSHCSCI